MKKEFDFSWIFQDPLRRVLDEGIVWEARPLLKLSCFQVLNVNRWMPGTVDFSAGCAIFTREDPSLLPRTRTNLWGLEEWWTDDFKMKQMLKMSKDLYITLLSHLLFITFYIQIFGSKHVCDQLWDLNLSELSLFCLEGDESNEAEGRWSHEEPRLRPLVKRGCLTSVASPGVSIHLFRPFGYYTWKSRHCFCERFWLGHVGSMNCISLNPLNDFFKKRLMACEFFHPRAGRSGHLGQPSPLRPAAFRIAGMAHALFGASPLCRRTHAHKAGLDEIRWRWDFLEKWCGRMRLTRIFCCIVDEWGRMYLFSSIDMY